MGSFRWSAANPAGRKRGIIDPMPGSMGLRRRSTLGFVATALYAVVLAAGAFEHHDIVCHLKNPQHCTACAANQLGSDPDVLDSPRMSELADAGRAIVSDIAAEETLLAVRSTGRSPPA